MKKHLRNFIRMSSLLLVFFVLVTTKANAAVATLTTVDSTNLSNAIIAASEGDTIVIGTGTITWRGDVALTKSLTLKAAPNLEVKPILTTKRLLVSAASLSLTLNGLEFLGVTGAAELIDFTTAALTMKNFKVYNCDIHNYIRALRFTRNATEDIDTIIFDKSTIYDKVAVSGNVYETFSFTTKATAKYVSITNSTFYNNGAGFFSMTKGPATDSCRIVIDHCTFYNMVNLAKYFLQLNPTVATNIGIKFTNNIVNKLLDPSNSLPFGIKNIKAVFSNNLISNFTSTTTASNFASVVTSGTIVVNANDLTTDPGFKAPGSGNFIPAKKSVVYTMATDGAAIGDPRWLESSANQIAAFVLKAIPSSISEINEASKTITVTVPFSTNLTTIIPTVSISAKSAVLPASDEMTDFSFPVLYKVTAENGFENTYTVTVQKEQARIDTDIESFGFSSPWVVGSVDKVNHKVSVEVPLNTNLQTLTPTFALSVGATAKIGTSTQTSGGNLIDFSSNVTYTITAEDEITTQDWEVSVVTAQSTLAEIIDFGFSGLLPAVSGEIDAASRTITLTVPYGTDVKNQIASFTVSGGAIAKVGTIEQTSGVTANDYSSAVSYTIVPQNTASTKVWTVIVNVVPPRTDSKLKDLKVNGVTLADFSADKMVYSYKLVYDYPAPALPTVSGSVNDSKAELTRIYDIPSVPGADTIVVTAQDASVRKYIINFSYDMNTDATLTGLKYAGKNVLKFRPDSFSYKVTGPSSLDSMSSNIVLPINASGASVQMSRSLYKDTKAYKDSVIITVTSVDTKYSKTYTLVASSTISSDATLKMISIGDTVVKNFSPTTTSYGTIVRPYGTTSVELGYKLSHDFATVKFIKSTDALIKDSIIVTAQDGKTKKIYTLKAIIGSNNSLASSIKISVSTTFSTTLKKSLGDTTYMVEVPFGTTKIKASVTKADENASVTTKLPSSFPDTAYIYVSSQDARSRTTYKVYVTLGTANTDASLKSIVLYANDTISEFSSSKTYYYYLLADTAETVPDIIATPTFDKATVSYTAAKTLYGESSIKVVAQDTSVKKTYTIRFTKSTNAKSTLAENISIFSNRSSLVIRSTKEEISDVSVSDVRGRIILSTKCNGQLVELAKPDQAGIYIVTVVVNQKKYTQKLIIE